MIRLVKWFRLFAILTIFASYISFVFFNGNFETHIMMIIFSLGILQYFKTPPDIGQVFIRLFDTLGEPQDDDDLQ